MDSAKKCDRITATFQNRVTEVHPGVSATASLHFDTQGEIRKEAESPEDVQEVDFPEGYHSSSLFALGGVGMIYESRQQALDRTVALKVLKANEHKDVYRRMFREEALLTAGLGHPTIPPVHDLVRNSAGTEFMVMKKIAGHSWNEVFQDMTFDENLEVLYRMADGIAFAHAQGVIHRDIKPENVRLGDFGEVYLMDWGLAKRQREDGTFLTEIGGGSGSGTPAYMSPEMALGIGPEIDFRSDIYLLGATLFELITGVPPHVTTSASDSLLAASENEIMEVEESNECLDIAYRAMQTEPEDRYPTVLEFQRAIREYREHAESLALNLVAEKHLERALETGDYAEFTEAQSGFKLAINLWPENSQAGDNLRQARLAYARHALEEGDLELAASQLRSTDPEEAELLNTIHHERRLRDARKRQRILLIRGVFGLLILILTLLIVATLWISQERGRAMEALDELQAEQRKRKVDNQKSAPAMVVTAKRLITYGDEDAATSAARAALEFDPELMDARYLEIGLLLQQRNFAKAAQAAERLLTRFPGEEDANVILRVSREAEQQGDEVDPGMLMQLVPILVRREMPVIAAAFSATRGEQLQFWKKRLLQFWPELDLSAQHFRWAGKDHLHLSIPSEYPIDTLEPLSGLPLAELDVKGQEQIHDLGPLRGMPLTSLLLDGCVGITDLGPLSGMPLRVLDLSNLYLVTTLEPLKGLPLESLKLTNMNQVADIEPLRGMPLHSLLMRGLNQLRRIDALEGMPLRELSLTGMDQLRRIDALEGMPLINLYMSRVTLDSYEPLTSLRLEVLYLDNANISDVNVLADLPLKSLSLQGTNVRDLEPLRNLALENLRVTRPISLEPLSSMPLEHLSIDQGLVDLRPLRTVPLISLNVSECLDVEPLSDLPLERLSIGDSGIKDPPRNLEKLRNLALQDLTIVGQALAQDLFWINGMTLASLQITISPWVENPVLDFSTIPDAQFQTLQIPYEVEVVGIDTLKQMMSIEKIGYLGQPLQPADLFLEELELRMQDEVN